MLERVKQGLQSPQGARIVATQASTVVAIVVVTVPARGANCSFNALDDFGRLVSYSPRKGREL